MAGFLDSNVDDNGLNWAKNTTQVLYITSSLCSTYAQVTSLAVGNSVGPSITGPAAGSPSGRAITVASTSAGSVTSTATASSWALVNTSGPFFVASYDLSAAQSVTSGNTFTLTAFTITIPAP